MSQAIFIILSKENERIIKEKDKLNVKARSNKTREAILKEFEDADDDEIFCERIIRVVIKKSEKSLKELLINNAISSNKLKFKRIGDKISFKKKDVLTWIENNGEYNGKEVLD